MIVHHRHPCRTSGRNYNHQFKIYISPTKVEVTRKWAESTTYGDLYEVCTRCQKERPYQGTRRKGTLNSESIDCL